MHKIKTAAWREDAMRVTSGPMGENDSFEAPGPAKVAIEMNTFFEWFNSNQDIDPVLKSIRLMVCYHTPL
jgi:Fic family protein